MGVSHQQHAANVIRYQIEGVMQQETRFANAAMAGAIFVALFAVWLSSASAQQDAAASRGDRDEQLIEAIAKYCQGVREQISRGERPFGSAVLDKNLKYLETLLDQNRQQRRELDRRQKQIFEERQRNQLLENEMELLRWQRDINDKWMRIEREKNLNRDTVMARNKQLNEERMNREALIRYVLFAGVIIFGLIAFLFIRRLQDRRRAVELKAEVAEAHAAALEAEKRQGEHEARKRFTRQLIDSQEQERKRIAADLHDGLGQDLLVIKNRITLARREVDRGGDLTHELDEIMTAVTSSLQDIRRISRNLRPFQLDRLGLTSTLETMCKTVRDSTTIGVDYSIDNVDGLFDKTREIDIYRIVQECLNNIVKHSEATVMRMVVEQSNGQVEFRIQDNGRGFSVEEISNISEATALGFGLQGMRERAAFLSGRLDLQSAENRGTVVTLTLPLADANDSNTQTEQRHVEGEKQH